MSRNAKETKHDKIRSNDRACECICFTSHSVVLFRSRSSSSGGILHFYIKDASGWFLFLCAVLTFRTSTNFLYSFDKSRKKCILYIKLYLLINILSLYFLVIHFVYSIHSVHFVLHFCKIHRNLMFIILRKETYIHLSTKGPCQLMIPVICLSYKVLTPAGKDGLWLMQTLSTSLK